MGRHDLIETVNKERLRVLLLGKPRCGKTTLAKQLEKSLNLVRVCTDTWIANLFKKIKDREENPPEEEPEPELEEGQERPPKKSWMEPLDEQVYNKLREGGAPD
jgi:DNA replication protein DnaC